MIYDQSPQHNDLPVQGPGTAAGQDVGANAARISVTAGGHKVYGIWVAPASATGTTWPRHCPRNGQPEGMYMVASGTHVNGGCCFDYGNAEATGTDTGNGHMDAVNIATTCYFAPCTGAGPWVEADMENGMFRVQRLQHREHRKRQLLRHRDDQEQRPEHVRAQGWQFPDRRTTT